ncbi:DUF6461 domain-containing protein [Yinghuangia seranimata]|uniref:DUF6461 domain-containing protein n=1 Tax=Yinghuangia seranimata TaxID=408067 RepID=UPI00248B23CC|nr:DUF6461 domain-containing protein [Yinghuangia seranimata]MDI2130529.1 DUF6461 domain-containing protein [Yinghuangia seranimata]
MSTATAADYGWIRSSTSAFSHAQEVGYGLTLVRGVTPAQVMRVMTAEHRGECVGAAGLSQRQSEVPWGDPFVTGAFTVPGEGGDWTLVLHFDGGVAMQSQFLKALSAGTRTVTHSDNGGKPMRFFYWYENGVLRTGFERPQERHGRTPDELVPIMRAVGFDPYKDSELTALDTTARSLALAERLTGVRVTDELLTRSVYQIGHVPWSWTP